MNPETGPEPDHEGGTPSRRTTILVAVAAVLAIVVVIGIVLVATSGGDDSASTASSSSSSVVTQTVTETPSTTDAPTTTDETTDETTTTETSPENSTANSGSQANPGGLVIYDCGGQTQVRPTAVSSIYCGDNSVSVTDVTWSRWGPRTAVGTGTENVNLCRPNCAAGNYERRAVDIELGKPERKAFTTITITGTDGVTQTYDLTGAAPN